MAALLWLGLAVAGSPAQTPEPAAPAAPATYKPTPTMSSNWWKELFGNKPKDEPIDTSTTIGVQRPVPTSTAERARELDRLQKAYLRRQAVCLRLFEIGEETNNNALKKEAQRLDDWAFQVYQDKSSPLLGAAPLDRNEKTEASKPAAPLSGRSSGRVLTAPEPGIKPPAGGEGER
jgi:hypothetical protein